MAVLSWTAAHTTHHDRPTFRAGIKGKPQASTLVQLSCRCTWVAAARSGRLIMPSVSACIAAYGLDDDVDVRRPPFILLPIGVGSSRPCTRRVLIIEPDA